jgi:hypothetical protein
MPSQRPAILPQSSWKGLGVKLSGRACGYHSIRLWVQSLAPNKNQTKQTTGRHKEEAPTNTHAPFLIQLLDSALTAACNHSPSESWVNFKHPVILDLAPFAGPQKQAQSAPSSTLSSKFLFPRWRKERTFHNLYYFSPKGTQHASSS